MPLYRLSLLDAPRPGDTVSFVVRAGSALRARELAADEAGNAWRDPARTTCREVEQDEQIIMSSRLKGAAE